MLKSMTGFGRGTMELGGRTLTVELRSVNSRYLEIHARVPREYSELEGTAKSCVKAGVLRGRIDLSLSIESPGRESYSLNTRLVNSYLRVARELQEQFQISNQLTMETLLQLPGVIDMEGNATAPALEDVRPVFEAALNIALAGLRSARAAEGEALAAEMKERLQSVLVVLNQVQTRSEGLLAHYQQRLAARLQEMLPEDLVPPDRIMMEAAMYAEKSDIREEVVRLRSHIDQFFRLMEADSEVGKHLDFLLQEMNREANTILSKAGPLEVTQLGVEMKAQIEKLREQVQNIE